MKEIKVEDIPEEIIETLEARKEHFIRNCEGRTPRCNEASLPGMVTQRSCVYGGARVILMPITDAIHLVHGPVGCAACTWDIRGSKSSGSQLYKTGFSTGLEEKEIVFGGEKKLLDCIIELNEIYSPSAIFVYSTCVAGVIGDDIKAVCRKAGEITGNRIIPVQSEGFRSFNKSLSHQLACQVLVEYLIGTVPGEQVPMSVNLVGEFNVAGDMWGIRSLLEELNIGVVASITGDSTVDEISRAHTASLNLVQCSKSSKYVAREMERIYGIPYIEVNFFGIEKTAGSLRKIAEFFHLDMDQFNEWLARKIHQTTSRVERYRERLKGKTVGIYVGGNKAWSLIKAFEDLGMEVIMTGTQNGIPEDYLKIRMASGKRTIVFDDANPVELSRLLKKYKPDLVVSGAKEKYLSYKLGIPFCEFNHDRLNPFSGFGGFLNFAEEVEKALNSPVWNLGSGG